MRCLQNEGEFEFNRKIIQTTLHFVFEGKEREFFCIYGQSKVYISHLISII